MKKFALALLAAASPATYVQANDATGNTPDTVTIVGNRPTSLPTQIPTTIEGIARADIERTINALDAQDALKYLPSLLVRKRYIGDYNHAVLSTRASGTGNSARSMVYADGILLSNYLGNGANFAPRWGMVSPEEIERVDVLYGPFSAAYGGNSVGAVVDYVTRMPAKFEAHAKFGFTHQHFGLYETHDSYRGKQASASLGNRQGRWSWFIDVNRSDNEGQPLTFPTRLVSAGAAPGGVPVAGAVLGQDRSNRAWYLLGAATQYRTVQDHVKAKLAYELTPSVRASYLLGIWQNDAQGRPTSYLRDAGGAPVYSGRIDVNGAGFALGATDFNASNEDLRHLMHGLSIKRHARDTFDWELAASLVDYDHDLLRAPTTALPAALTGGPGRLVDMSGTGWNTVAAKGIWRPDGIAGAHVVEFGYARDSYKLASIENATAAWIGGAPGARTQAFSGRTRTQALWAQDTWRFAPGWKTVLGVRVERWRAQEGRTSNASTTVAHGERADTHVSPKAALAWQVAPLWVLKASAGRAVRMPTVSELYQGGVSGSGTLVNNDPGLRPERSWTGELSAERELEGGQLRITAFGERTVDALYSQTNVLATPNVTNVQNVGRIETKGLELAYHASDVGLNGLDVQSSATWTDSTITRNDNFPASVGKRQPRIARWRATGVATYRAGDRLALTLAARYSGRQFSTLDNSDPNGFAYQGASRFFTVDTRLSWQVARQWKLAVGVDNLNNYRYWNFHPYSQRTYVMEARYDLE